MNNFESLYSSIGYKFKNENLLIEALTHPSCRKKRKVQTKNNNIIHTKFNYERLEFLGDRVLNLAVAHHLFLNHPEEDEGGISQRHSNTVSGITCTKIAKQINLDQYIILSQGEEKGGGRENNANLENCIEALIAAIYLDSNIDEAVNFVKRLWESELDTNLSPMNDEKGMLQEWFQKNKNGSLPSYNLISTTGPEHDPVFEIEININNEQSIRGVGSTKKEAEKQAAQKAIKMLKLV